MLTPTMVVVMAVSMRVKPRMDRVRNITGDIRYKCPKVKCGYCEGAKARRTP